ncbi:D-amino acid dehydrogenase small subunit [Ruegeria denitrificans]|uniref:D-amino acid dehydrogenase small subunit n=1 Tax=Ruegeria denitrificans TaxID=1715692 RepID=A0A0P1I9H1_9RHOB|nr:FAD-dependent oxidoreductase [Ruegeria denitrificans]CUJ99327.1 D-amino acid dehydrogenase small subunit [Ruegeria denitrificans]
MTRQVVVIGAGVIGITTALELQRRGHSVLVLDREGVAAQASAGNAGAFAFSEVEPLATPGIMRKAPKWLLDPLGPLSIPPSYALKIAPWIFRFWRASRPGSYQNHLGAQASLMEHAAAALTRLIADVDGEPMMQRDGQMQLYESQAEFRASLPAWELRRQHGIEFELLESRAAIAEKQPGLSPRFTHAGFTPNWMNTVDPRKWVEYLAQNFRDRGGRVETQDTLALTSAEGGVQITIADGEINADKVVLCAGAWSHHLARTLGDHIPLETERGYNTTFPAGAFDLRMPLTFSGHGFVATRINGGVRIGGAVELGGLSLPPNYKRADALLKKAVQFLPGLNTEGGTQWMGFRPSLPDSLPVIGASPNAPDVIYAFGHGHLGLTQSAGTAELVGALIDGLPPQISLTPFSATRF